MQPRTKRPATEISVLLVEDHELVREGLRAILATEPDLRIAGEAANGKEAIALTRATRPNLVLMDLAMPVMNGIEATRQIKRAFPSTRVLVLTSYGDEDYVNQALEVGAAGYLMKQTAATELVEAIRAIFRGETRFSPGIARRLRERSKLAPGRSRCSGKGSSRLTLRETEVLQSISDGLSNKEIAATLAISIKTVEKHRQRVMDKLGIHETAGLTRYVLTREVGEHRNAF